MGPYCGIAAGGALVFMTVMRISRTFSGLTGRAAKPGERARRMGSTVSLALLAYTALQIGLAVTMGGRSGLPYAGLALLVIVVIPACRAMEARWARLGDAPALEARFRGERLAVWAAALGLPLLLTGGFGLIGL